MAPSGTVRFAFLGVLVFLVAGCLQAAQREPAPRSLSAVEIANPSGIPSADQLVVTAASSPVMFSQRGHRYTEFNTASNPTNPDEVAVGVIDWDDPAGSTACAVFVSKDGGRTWTGGVPPAFRRYGLGGDPWVAIDATGRIHAACIEQRPRGDASTLELYYMHSDDLGATWSPKVRINSPNSGMDKDAMGVDSKGNIYACFSEGRLKVAISRDRGDTWEIPIAPFDDLQGNCNGIYEGPEGTVNIGFLSLRGRYPFRGVGVVSTSDDGRTWNAPVLADVFHLEPSCSGPSCPTQGMFGTLQSFAASPLTGTVFVAVNNMTRNNTYQLQLSRLERGETRFERFDGPTHASLTCARCSQWRPAIAVDALGRLGMRWYAGPSAAERSVWFAASADEGRTWTTPIKLAKLPVEQAGLTIVPAVPDPVHFAAGAQGFAEDFARNPRGATHAMAFGFLYEVVWPIGKDEGGHYDAIAPTRDGFVAPWLAMTATGAPEMHAVAVAVSPAKR